MNARLTVSLDSNVIEEAKLYAKVHSTSVSKLIEHRQKREVILENYLVYLSDFKFNREIANDYE
jgi:hypothetical protein